MRRFVCSFPRSVLSAPTTLTISSLTLPLRSPKIPAYNIPMRFIHTSLSLRKYNEPTENKTIGRENKSYEFTMEESKWRFEAMSLRDISKRTISNQIKEAENNEKIAHEEIICMIDKLLAGGSIRDIDHHNQYNTIKDAADAGNYGICIRIRNKHYLKYTGYMNDHVLSVASQKGKWMGFNIMFNHKHDLVQLFINWNE